MESNSKLNKIEEIYREYIKKISDLRGEQNRILDEFRAELEKAKMEEIRSKLNN